MIVLVLYYHDTKLVIISQNNEATARKYKEIVSRERHAQNTKRIYQ
uniref:Uncharacterized protein n=1 Tax=Arundo donax TaxID=35708 RepID=A0A0A9BR63_ARUDO